MDKVVENFLKDMGDYLKQSEDFKTYIEAKKQIESDEECFLVLKKYKKTAHKLQSLAILNKEPSDEDTRAFEQWSSAALEDERIANYVCKEMVLKNEVSRIIQHLAHELELEY